MDNHSWHVHNRSKGNNQLIIPELNEQRLITAEVHLTAAKMGYDITIGIDLLIELGIVLKNSTQVIKWDDTEIPMRAQDSTVYDSYLINDPPAIQS